MSELIPILDVTWRALRLVALIFFASAGAGFGLASGVALAVRWWGLSLAITLPGREGDAR